MQGNLDVYYQLRMYRLNRLRDRFRRGDIHQSEFRDLLAAEGIISNADQTAEVMLCAPDRR